MCAVVHDANGGDIHNYILEADYLLHSLWAAIIANILIDAPDGDRSHWGKVTFYTYIIILLHDALIWRSAPAIDNAPALDARRDWVYNTHGNHLRHW